MTSERASKLIVLVSLGFAAAAVASSHLFADSNTSQATTLTLITLWLVPVASLVRVKKAESKLSNRSLPLKEKTMKAIACPTYGSPDVLELQEVAKPVPKENEVLVKIHAASIDAGDWHLMRADPFIMRLIFGLTKPRQPILGGNFAGQIEAAGENVTQFQVGDEVFGASPSFGVFAEYVAVPENAIVLKPANVSF